MTKRLRNKNTFNKKDTGLKENSQILLKIQIRSEQTK